MWTLDSFRFNKSIWRDNNFLLVASLNSKKTRTRIYCGRVLLLSVHVCRSCPYTIIIRLSFVYGEIATIKLNQIGQGDQNCCPYILQEEREFLVYSMLIQHDYTRGDNKKGLMACYRLWTSSKISSQHTQKVSLISESLNILLSMPLLSNATDNKLLSPPTHAIVRFSLHRNLMHKL